MANNYTLSPSPFQKFFLADGVTPNANGRVFTFLAGLSTAATTYRDSAGLIQNSNPIQLDGSGQCTIFLAPGSYAYAVYAAPLIAGLDTSGGLIETQDNIAAVPPNIYTVQFFDYASLSTIVGWSSYTGGAGRKVIFVEKIGRRVFVDFNIEGTSNSAVTSFTLPYPTSSMGASATLAGPCGTGQDNGGAAFYLNHVIGDGSSLVTFSIAAAGTGWTAAGAKQITGQFQYNTP